MKKEEIKSFIIKFIKETKKLDPKQYSVLIDKINNQCCSNGILNNLAIMSLINKGLAEFKKETPVTPSSLKEETNLKEELKIDLELTPRRVKVDKKIIEIAIAEEAIKPIVKRHISTFLGTVQSLPEETSLNKRFEDHIKKYLKFEPDCKSVSVVKVSPVCYELHGQFEEFVDKVVIFDETPKLYSNNKIYNKRV
jgi:hypothetical protein